MADYLYYLTDKEYDNLNNVQIFLMIEKDFNFSFIANLESLRNITTANSEAFFRNPNAGFTFSAQTRGLNFGDGIIEDFLNEALQNPSVELKKSIAIASHNLIASELKINLDHDLQIEAYCCYIDLLLQRRLPKDLTDIEKNISKCL